MTDTETQSPFFAYDRNGAWPDFPEGQVAAATGMPMHLYHNDAMIPATLRPALSASRARDALTRSPAHMFHRVMNAEVEDEAPRSTNKHLRIGTAAHSLILRDEHAGESFVVGSPNFTDFRGGAKAEAQVATEQGKVFLLDSEYQVCQGMYDAYARSEMAQRIMRDGNGNAEVSAFWRMPEEGSPMEMCRFDWLPDKKQILDGFPVIDYKTCESINKWERAEMIDRKGALRLRLYYDAVIRLYFAEYEVPPVVPYCYLLQEKEAPYFMQAKTLRLGDPEDKKAAVILDIGGQALEIARRWWREALETGLWPQAEDLSTFSEMGFPVDRWNIPQLSQTRGIRR